MKKIPFVTVCLLVLMLFVSCNGKKDNMESRPAETPAPSQSPMATEEPKRTLLGKAETEILDGEENRIHNISLAISAIDGFTLEPGETFSFNDTVGPRTSERGYKEASVIIQMEKRRDFGGGVCQVSSTLFQAARSAGFEVFERHSHQKDVGYAHQGDDAAVDYGAKDLRFQNTTEGTVAVSMSVTDGFVVAEIYDLS